MTLTKVKGSIRGEERIFDTVAAMKAAADLDQGITARTRGYYTAGDGGGAEYLVAAPQAVDGYGDHTLANGNAAVLKKNEAIFAIQYGVKTDGSNTQVALEAARDAADNSNKALILPEGSIGLTNTFTISRSGDDTIGFTMRGQGRSLTTFVRESGTFTDMIEITCAGSFSLNNELSGFGVSLADTVDTGINGVKLNAGIWRSKFEDLYITRPNTDKTGKGIYGGSATPLDKGFYDNKFSKLYISNFDKNIHFEGTSLSNNTVTNTSISDSYIGGAVTANLHVDYFNGFIMTGSQLEAHETDGALFDNGDSAIILGGSIESPEAGAVGVNMDANTKSVVALCDFFNNAGGNFISNNKIGHWYKTNQSGIILPAGGELTVDSDGTNFSRVRFFEDGVADVYMSVSNGGDGVSLRKNDLSEAFKWDVTNGINDIINGSGYIRLQNGSDLRFLQSGITTRDIMGAGSPEGVVTANPGSTYRNRNGGAGTTFYVKESGTGNTGWVGK